MEIRELTAAGQAPGRTARGIVPSSILLAALLAGLVSAAAAWWVSPAFLSIGWLMPVVAIPAGLAAVAVGLRDGRRALAITALVAAATCSIGAWWGWTPPPAIFEGIRARQEAATAVAEATMASQAPGTCQPAASIDLGSLADLGPWDQVCVWGPADGSSHGFELQRAPGSDAFELVYTMGAGPISVNSCLYDVAGNWWVVGHPAGSMSGCPRGFTYTGSG